MNRTRLDWVEQHDRDFDMADAALDSQEGACGEHRQRFLKSRRPAMSPLCGFFAVVLLALSAWGVLALIGAAVKATL